MKNVIKKKLRRRIIIAIIILLFPVVIVSSILFISADMFEGHFASKMIDDNLDEESNSKLKQILIDKVEKVNNDNTFDENGQRIGKLSDYYGIDKGLELTWPYVQAYIKYRQISSDASANDDSFDQAVASIDQAVDDLKPKFIYEKQKIATVTVIIVQTKVGPKAEILKSEGNMYVLKQAKNLQGTYEIDHRMDTTSTTNGNVTVTVTKPVISGFRQIDSQYDPLKSIILKDYPNEDINLAIDGLITLTQNYLGEPIGSEMYYTGSGTFTGSGEAFTGDQKQFIDKVSVGAIEAYKEYNILPSITIAQAALESEWGKSGLTQKANNLFGIKGLSGWTGPYVDMLTTEYNDAGPYNIIQRFRAYNSWDDSIKDHSRVLMQSNFTAVRAATNYVDAAKALKAGGYAEDPEYAAKIVSFIQEYGLDKYDNAK